MRGIYSLLQFIMVIMEIYIYIYIIVIMENSFMHSFLIYWDESSRPAGSGKNGGKGDRDMRHGASYPKIAPLVSGRTLLVPFLSCSVGRRLIEVCQRCLESKLAF